MNIRPSTVWANSGNPKRGVLTETGWIPGRGMDPTYPIWYYGFELGYAQVVSGIIVEPVLSGPEKTSEISIQISTNNLTWAPLLTTTVSVPTTIRIEPPQAIFFLRLVMENDGNVGGRFGLVGCTGDSLCQDRIPQCGLIPTGSCDQQDVDHPIYHQCPRHCGFCDSWCGADDPQISLPNTVWANSGNPLNGVESSSIGWLPGTDGGGPEYGIYYYGFSFGYAAVVTGLRISTASNGHTITSFGVQQSLDNKTWTAVGPQHGNIVPTTIWFPAMPTKYLRVVIENSGNVGARFSVIGCSGNSKCLANSMVPPADCYAPSGAITNAPTATPAVCNDNWSWRSAQGLCEAYAADSDDCKTNPATCNHAFCDSDTDLKTGEVASVGCPKSCARCI